MSDIIVKHYALTAIPATWEADAYYSILIGGKVSFYVTGSDGTPYLMQENQLDGKLSLDQTTPQTISGGQPIQDILTASELVATDASKKLQSLAVATYPSLTELSYIKGLTSAVQTQINTKAIIPVSSSLTLAVADWRYLAKTSTMVAGGTGYTANDILTFVGGTGTAPTIKVLTVDGAGAILTHELLTAGSYTVIPANPVAVTGGTGNDDATFNLTYTIEQEKTVSGLTATSIYSARVGSDNTSFTTAKAYGVRDLSTDTDTITFTCVEEPDDDIDINLVISKY